MDNHKENTNLLNKKAISFGVLAPTKTAINKSIIDAIYSLRLYFKEKKFHDYDYQKKGEKNKSIRDCKIIEENNIIDTKVSLYRPETKDGDPRIWIYSLKKIVEGGNKIILILKEDILFVFNSSKISLAKVLNEKNNSNEIFLFINSFDITSHVAKELKDRLINIAKLGFIEGKKGDKEVGEVLERNLGIKANSNKLPDYKGIEIKSKHSENTRSNLFALVPNYKHPLSKINKITDIADEFGYYQKGVKVLANTIFSTKTNSQGLRFNIDYKRELLFETSTLDNKLKDFAVWEFQTLINRLKEKHKETFWINAEKKNENKKLFFKYKSVVHTSNPNTHLFIDFIAQDIVTMDHIIRAKKNKDSTMGRREAGPLFKIYPKNLNLLIPIVEKFNLVD
jgi:hypothetical protein